MAKFKVPEALAGLTGPFTKIARAMSRNYRVEIIPHGTKCATDGEKIYIPYNADKLTPELQTRLNGQLDHEVAHVVEETEAKEAGRVSPMKLMRNESNNTVARLFNVYEDIRIERKASERYPGVAEDLADLNRHYVEKFRRDRGTGGGAWHEIGCAIIGKARGFEVDWLRDDLRSFFDRCDDFIARCDEMRSAEDALALARETYDALRDLAEEIAEEEQSADESGDEGEGEESEGEGQSKGGEESDDDGEGDDGEEGEGEESGDDEGEGEGEGEESEGEESGDGEGEGEESEGEESDGEGDEGDDDGHTDDERRAAREINDGDDIPSDERDPLESARKEIEKDVKGEAEKGRHYVPNPDSARKDGFQEIKVTSEAEASARQARDDVRGQISALRARMVAVLQTITRTRQASAKRRGRLDRRALVKARLGSDAVFTERQDELKLDTAIEHLVDMSGSMGMNDDPGGAAYYAERTAIGLAEAWDAIGVKSEFIGFWNDYHGGVRRRSGFVNRAPLRYYSIKRWDETTRMALPRFGNIYGIGDNTDGEAVLYAAKRLAARPESRKILVVISDGMPCAAGADHYQLCDHLRDVVKLVSAAGIEVVGIGAGTEAPARFYNKSTGASNVVIDDLSTMAERVFRVLRDRVISGTKRRAA